MNDKFVKYSDLGIESLPRILSCMDRNRYSPTYGCLHRDYWLYKTSDFPDAVRQFGLHALALAYSKNLPKNSYYQNKKILEWTIAGLLFWSKIQHTDGSFDEFYPNERGWVGPTAFTTYTSIETFNLIREKISSDKQIIILNAIKKSAYFIAKGDHEGDDLANHHAMACLALWKAFKLTNDLYLEKSYYSALEIFKTYHDYKEGWSKEYDGIDPGYLSATISFLGKIFQDNKSKEILEIVRKAIDMSSYFIYPNGFYGGSLGSRNTMHFYSHGFEIFKDIIPLANTISEVMLDNISQNKLVPPNIMSDRYLFYRVPELLLTYIDSNKNINLKPKLPYQKNSLTKFFTNSKIWVNSNKNNYIIANLAKGAVFKVFCKKTNKLIVDDCGIIGELSTKKIITSQWVDNNYEITLENKGFTVTGVMSYVPSNKYFNIVKLIIFRFVLLLIGWTSLTHKLKGLIRKILMVGNRRTDISFIRTLSLKKNKLIIETKITNLRQNKFISLSIGDDFFVRYVPQSRFFQHQELETDGYALTNNELNKLNKFKEWSNKRVISLT